MSFQIRIVGGPSDGKLIEFKDNPSCFELIYYDPKDVNLEHIYKRTSASVFKYEGERRRPVIAEEEWS